MKTVKDWKNMDKKTDDEFWTNRMTEVVFRVLTLLIYSVAIGFILAPMFIFWATGDFRWMYIYFVYFVATAAFLIWCAFRDPNGIEDEEESTRRYD